MTIDPQVSYRHWTQDGSLIEPSVSLQGIWNFAHDSGLSTSNAGEPEDFRARLELGVTLQTPGGISLGLSGGYDGIGAEDYDAFSGELRLEIPLN
jgi:hypothetical protein